MSRLTSRVLAPLTAAVALAAGVLLATPAGATEPTGSNPTSEQDIAALSAQVDGLEGQDPEQVMEQLLEVVPQQTYAEHPEIADLIQGGAPPVTQAVHSGATIPGCPAAGAGLLPGLPAPYGYFPPNPTNNWCLPNWVNGGCSYTPDSGLTFDFRSACRQHDLAYQWKPVDSRFDVDNRFLVDMGSDCVRRSWVAQPFCYARAGIYYAGVRLFGSHAYGSSTRPGYNAPVPPEGVPAIPAPPTCAQPTHPILGGGSGTVARGTTLYLSGVVRKFSRVRYDFRSPDGTLLADHLTYFAGDNCVVAHEREGFNTAALPVGTVEVTAVVTRWEDPTTVTVPVTTLQIVPGGGSTRCNQATHVWMTTLGGSSTVTQGGIVYATGVVRRGTRIHFQLVDSAGGVAGSHLTQPARDNCVVHHEPEAYSTAGLAPGTYTVRATYTEWETDETVTRDVHQLAVLENTGGGGGGPGPWCPELPEYPVIQGPAAQWAGAVTNRPDC